MSTVTRYPTTDTAVTGTWTNPTAVQADDGTLATVAQSAKNTDAGIREQGGFGFDGQIPSGAVINTVTLEVEQMVSTNAGIANQSVLARLAAVDGTPQVDTAEPLTITARSYSITRPGGGTWTRADLLDGTFKTRIRGFNGNSATATTYSWDYVRVTVDYSLPIAIGTVSDDFNDNSIDGAKWTATAGVAETSSELQITASSAFPSIRNFNSLGFTIADSFASIETIACATGASAVLSFRDDANANGFYMEWTPVDGVIYLYERVASTNDVTSVAYDATNHRWWRLRHDTTAGFVYWETSATGAVGSWTVRRSKAPVITLSGKATWIYSGGTTPSGITRFDNFNIIPSAPVSAVPKRRVVRSVAMNRASRW